MMRKINKESKQAEPSNLGVGQEDVFSHCNNTKIKLTVATTT